MKNTYRVLIFAIPLFFFPFSPPLLGVTIDLVTVGNPGNAPDQDYGDGQFGAVADTYRIGRTEVTNSQYAEFLNAVAATDTHSLYNSSMDSSGRGGITQSGSSGSFTYSVKTNFDDKPVNFVSFWDAARFTNWLHNGQPTGAQDNSTTEDGAYALGGVTNPTNNTIFREPGAAWFIPTEDQWYKAAYHQPELQGGDTDDYWFLPTATNSSATKATADSVGNISNPGIYVMNYDSVADWNSQDGNVTTVGSAGSGSTSFYGTFDQGGNLFEWNETILHVLNDRRGVRGGAWYSVVGDTASVDQHLRFPSSEDNGLGFRVASLFSESSGGSGVPEPASGGMLLMGLIGFARRRRGSRWTGSPRYL